MKKVTQKNIVVEIIEECDPFWKAQTNLIKKKKRDEYNLYSMFIQNDDHIFSLSSNKDSFKKTLS